MKRFLIITLALAMLLGLAACGKGGSGSSGSGGKDAAGTAAALVPRTLSYVNLKDGDKPVIRGVFLAGNQAGTTEYNTGDPAADGIRCIFELSEWIDVYLDTDVKEGLQVWAFEHKKDLSYYADAKFSDETPGFRAVCDLNKNEDGLWGSFYLHPEYDPGLIDLVFTRDGKAVALLLTKFYKEGELDSKTDAELDKLMSGIAG